MDVDENDVRTATAILDRMEAKDCPCDGCKLITDLLTELVTSVVWVVLPPDRSPL